MEDDLDRIAHPVLQREDLTAVAREPLEETAGAGFGSYYEGPQVDREDATVLSPERMSKVDGEMEPVRATYPTSETGWESHESRDFRREDSNEDYERSTSGAAAGSE